MGARRPSRMVVLKTPKIPLTKVFRPMPRPRHRVCLEAGLKLELYQLMRRGCVVPGAWSSFRMRWWENYTGEEIAIAECTVCMRAHEGSFRMVMDDMDETIILTPRSRRFGGEQWYFVCPYEDRCCSVLWRPPGAGDFRCRQAWGRRVAYSSQFLDRTNRAHRGKAKIKTRLISDYNPDDWELPPKPKWMRWSTYNRYVERFDRYEAILDEGVEELWAKLGDSNLFSDK
jgi:hypothetical protein